MLEIRLARSEELAEVGRLTVAAYVGDGYLHKDADYVRQILDTPARASDSEIWVALDVSVGNPVLGAVTFCPAGSTYREIGHDGEGEFRMLAVSAAARGRGVGQALVEACLQRSRDLGYAGVRVCSMDQMTTAHRLYERLGFVRAPEDDWSPDSGVRLLAYAVELRLLD